MFKVHENGKVYNVSVRGAYQHTIKSERRLRLVVDKSFSEIYGEECANKHSLFEKCSTLGILEYTCPVNR